MNARRICLFLLTAFLLCAASAAGAEHLCLKARTELYGYPIEESIDFYLQDGEVAVLSSLLPDYQLTGKLQGSFPDVLEDDLIPGIIARIRSMNPDREEGLFAGDTFELARVCEQVSLNARDFLGVFRGTDPAGRSDEDRGDDDVLLRGLEDLKFLVRMFDGGKAFSVAGIRGDETFCTLSMTPSDDGKNFDLVAGMSEKGKDYYWAFRASGDETDGRVLQAQLYADAKKQGFRTLSQSRAVLEEEWKVSMPEEDGSRSFSGVLTPGSGASPILISGRLRPGDASVPAEAVVSFQNDSSLEVKLTLEKDQEPLPAGERTVLRLAEISDEEVQSIRNEINAHCAEYGMSLVLALPHDYMDRILETN